MAAFEKAFTIMTWFVAALVVSGASERSVQFANPPSEALILKIIHNWPDAAEARDCLIRNLQNQGFGGVVCNVSFEKYLESESNGRHSRAQRLTGPDRSFACCCWPE